MKFSIVIPTVNQTTLVSKCIASIRGYSSQDTEIIVVDDGSEPETRKYIAALPGVKVIQKETNTGFADTVNHGIRAASGDVVVLVNNDVVFVNDVCAGISSAMNRDEKTGVVGVLLKYPHGTIQHAGMELKAGKVLFHADKGLGSSILANKGRYCPAVTGAVFAIRRECLSAIGPLDTSFFLACEDSDYCLRAWQAGWRVWFEPSSQAVHIEGATRGNDIKTKSEKPRIWHEREKASIAVFNQRYLHYDFRGLQNKINSLNGVTAAQFLKLEIGSGNNPQPGYVHIDARRLHTTDLVLDFERQVLPYQNGMIEEILSNHCIEHISWRSLPFVFREWHRVLRPGGRVFLRTPDLEFICKTYLAGKTTKECPGDEQHVTNNLSDVVTPAWWANIKLFAGQDYSENYHYLCFDFPMLKALAEKFGFKDVRRLDIQPVYSPGEIQAEFFK